MYQTDMLFVYFTFLRQHEPTFTNDGGVRKIWQLVVRIAEERKANNFLWGFCRPEGQVLFPNLRDSGKSGEIVNVN